MGRLVGLELYNFKSYKGKTLVGFGTSYFTSIIGPNGSGKSNMMDAISFVLGVRSNQLRSKNIKSLIYRGQINNGNDDGLDEDEDENEDVGNLLMMDPDSDVNNPDSAYVSAIYEKENKEILNLKRTINSNGTTTFNVNGVDVSVNQYLKILKDEKILIKAKNFLVFQGDVEKVASQSPSDLTKMIENISGSINFKTDYDNLKDEKDKAHDITALKNSQKRNIRDEIKTLKAKCLESDQFDKKTKILEKTIVYKYLSKLNYIDRLNQILQVKLESKNDSLNNISTAIETKQQEYKDFVLTQSDDHMSIKQYESKIESDESNIKLIKTKLIPLESEALQLSKKINDYDDKIIQIKTEMDEQQSTINETDDILNDVKTVYDKFLLEKEKIDDRSQASYTANLEMLNDYNKLRDQFLLKAGDIEIKLSDLNDEKDSLSNEIESLKLSKGIINTRINVLESDKSILTNKKSSIDSSIASNESSIKSFQKELNSLESLRDSINEKEKFLNSELKTVLLRLNEINAIQRENARERKLRETVSTLKRIFPNVRGLLNDICKPKQKKYGIALAAILGRNFDSIVVDTIQTATECIEYMKEKRLGVASFIPLDTVKIQPLDSNLRGLSDNSKPVIDIISYPPEFEKAVQYVCGNSLVCDTIEIATSLKWSKGINVKIVALDGSLIHKSGLMTGGGTDNFSNKWDKSEIGLLNERKEELKNKITELHSQIPDDMKDRILNEEIERLQARIPEYNRIQEDNFRALRDNESELNHEYSLITEIDTKIEKHHKEIGKILSLIDHEKIQLNKYQKEIYSEFCDLYGFKNINDYELNYNARLIEETRENAKYIKEIQRLEIKLNFEKERLDDYQKRLNALTNDQNIVQKRWETINNEKESIEDQLDELISELDIAKENYNKLKKKVVSLLSKAGEMETDIKKLKSDLKEIRRDIITIEEKIDAIKMDKKTALVNAKLENVKVPLISGSLNDVPLEDGATDPEEISQQWADVLEVLEINYSKLHDDYYAFIPEEEDDDGDVSMGYNENNETIEVIEAKCEAEIEKLQQELRDMNPDVRAREHLESAQERYKDVEDEFIQAKNEEKEILANFEKIKDERHSLFMKAFEHVSEHIDDVYKELTKSRASPLGGSAYLTLEDEDEPYCFGIKYHIMPPLKRFRDMENLSGGEKTIGALALLFAVHSFHPSPFFVLDEVDAALDNSNVNKIANYICKNKGPNFQFIVISLKNSLFERSDALVGIYRDQELNSSKILTVDLRDYTD